MDIKFYNYSENLPSKQITCHSIFDQTLQYGVLCTSDEDSSRHFPSDSICLKLKSIITAQKEKILEFRSNLLQSLKQEICANISTDIKNLNRSLKLQAESKFGRNKLEISFELVIFLDDVAALFHVGDTRTYTYHQSEFALITKDQNNLEAWIDRKETTYEEGRKEKDAFDLVNGLGYSGILRLETKFIPLSSNDRFLFISRRAYRSLRSLRLRAILSSKSTTEIIPQCIEELKTLQFSSSFGILVAEVDRSKAHNVSTKAWSFLDRFNIIKSSTFFSTLNQEECLKLISICKARQISAGEVLIRQGSNDRDFYFILDGQLEITINNISVGIVGKGEVIGEMSAFDNAPRSADVIAKTLSYLMMFTYNDFHTFLERDVYLANKIYTSVLKELINRLKTQTLKTKYSKM